MSVEETEMEDQLAEQIRRAALECGFDQCGIIPLESLEGFAPLLREREEKVPSSKKFYAFPERLDQTQQRFPWAKAMVVCSFWYGKYRYPAQLRGRYAKDFFLKPGEDATWGYDRPDFERRLARMGVRFAGGEEFLYYSVAPLRYAAQQPEEFWAEHVIPRADHHLKAGDEAVLKKNAQRALEFQKRAGIEKGG